MTNLGFISALLSPIFFWLVKKLIKSKRKKFSNKTIVILGLIAITGIIFSMIAEILTSYDIYLAGYRTTSKIMIISTAFIAAYNVVDNRPKPMSHLYMIKSFLAGIAVLYGSLLLFALVVEYDSRIQYNQGEFRIEDTHRFLGPCDYKLFIRNGLFDYAYDVNIPCYVKWDKIEIKKSANKVYILTNQDEKSESIDSVYIIQIK